MQVCEEAIKVLKVRKKSLKEKSSECISNVRQSCRLHESVIVTVTVPLYYLKFLNHYLSISELEAEVCPRSALRAR